MRRRPGRHGRGEASGAGDISQDIQLRRAGRRFGSSRAHTVRSNDGGGSTATALSSMTPSTCCSRTYSRGTVRTLEVRGGALLVRRRRLAVVVKNQFVVSEMLRGHGCLRCRNGRGRSRRAEVREIRGRDQRLERMAHFFHRAKDAVLGAFVFRPSAG
jgi:hypothetical protein